jgi:hypothetical protein
MFKKKGVGGSKSADCAMMHGAIVLIRVGSLMIVDEFRYR